jgi:hypothetical protein
MAMRLKTARQHDATGCATPTRLREGKGVDAGGIAACHIESPESDEGQAGVTVRSHIGAEADPARRSLGDIIDRRISDRGA